ncbi:MAG: hypothetical protein NVSMB19_17250 [Vulcanimicrobiaceae bacterium]
MRFGGSERIAREQRAVATACRATRVATASATATKRRWRRELPLAARIGVNADKWNLLALIELSRVDVPRSKALQRTLGAVSQKLTAALRCRDPRASSRARGARVPVARAALTR